MRKTKFTKIASILTMLAMLLTLTAAFAVGVSAAGTAQAQWGTDAANLTSSGTLQEALDAAAGDTSITYIKLVSDVALGDSYVMANGGKFTLDLNGKTVTATSYPFSVSNAVDITFTDSGEGGAIQSTGSSASAISVYGDSAINITLAGGTFVGAYPINASNSGALSSANLTITGGTLQTTGYAHIYWGSTGVLDLSGYGENLDGITIFNTGSTITLPSENILLPEGFDIYRSGEKVTEMKAGYYTVNGTYVEPTPDPEPVIEAQWGTDAANLTNEGTLQEALDAAGGDASITYIKLVSNVALGDSNVMAKGGKFTLDLNGKAITGDSYPFSLKNATDITIEDTSVEQTGTIESASAGAAALIVGDGDAEQKVTINGGIFKSNSYAVNVDGNGSVAMAEVTINGGKFIGDDYVVKANGTYFAVLGGEFEGGNWAQIVWNSGTLDFSNHPAPAGITVRNYTGADVTLNGENIILPEGCYISDTAGGSAVTTLANGTTYYVVEESTTPDPTPDPEPVIEVQWGTDAENLTGSGTLIEAFYAAAAENSTVAYIKMISDVTLEVFPNTTGGTFTFDLNGKKLSTGGLFSINGADITITDTAGNGVIDAVDGEQAVALVGGKLTLLSGEIHGEWDLYWEGGELDLQSYPMLTGFVLYYAGGALGLPDASILLPDGYSVYYGNDSSLEKVDRLENSCSYFIDETKYKVTVNETANGVVIADQTGYLTPGTEVTLTVTPDDGYRTVINVTGATFDPETNTFVVESSDVTVDVTFRLYQAEWGTDKDTLTAWGTLEEAFDAAAADASITYIKVMNNFDIGNDPYFVEGGKFTLDLNGKTVTSAGHVLYLKNAVDITITDNSAEQTGKIESTTLDEVILVHDTSAINITIEGGTLSSAGRVIVAHSAFGEVLTVNLTIKGGTLQTAINEHIWWGSTGVLDLSDYANPTGITVNNFSGAEPNITLPAGYSFYDKKGNRVDGAFENVLYTIDEAQYQLSWDIGNGINGESSSFSHGNEMLVWCTPVSFTLVLLDHYELVSVALNGEALEPDAETGVYSFVMPEDDVTVTVQAKYAPFVWGNTSDAMTNTGDFFELVAAINAGQAPYAKLLADYDVELLESDVTVSGKSHIDFGEYYLNVYNAAVILGEGADITFFGDQKVDDINADCNVFGSFELQVGSKLTISGTAFWGEILYNGGTLDISGAHLTTACHLYNLTNAEITIADVVTFAAPFRAIDPAWYNDPNYEGYTVPTVTTLAARVENIASAYIEAVFTVTFDFGEGSGTMPTFEHTFDSRWESFPTPEGLSHPDGLTLIGWVYEGDGYEIFDCDYIFPPELTDATIKAKWGAPLYVGGVGMNDGDYLASGATDTTKSRPTTGGYAYYKNGVLTLNNYQFSGDGFAHEDSGYDGYKSYSLIYSTTDLVIELVGSSNLVGTAVCYEEDYDYYFDADTDGIRIKGDLSVRGKGSLNIKVEDDGFYIEDLIFESGTVTVGSNDEAIESDSITVLDGALITVSEDGIDSKNVTVKGGEFYVLPEDDDDNIEFDTQTLTVTGGKLVVKGYGGIYADYVTISGGVVEVEAENAAIYPWDEDNEDGFVTISGGKVTLYSEYSDAIYSTGDVTVSGGEVTLYGYYGIYTYGNITFTGGELEIEAYEDAIYAEGDVTISGGDIYIYSYEDNGIGAYGNITISGGDVVISVGDGYAIEAYGGETAVTINGGFVHLMGHIGVTETTTVTFGGKATQIFIEGDIIATISPVITEGEIKNIFTVDGTSYYEGVEISHNWTDAYQADETHHYHICANEDCVIRYFYLPEFYYQYFEDANYGEHTVPEGEAACSVCGYGAEVPEEEIPEDAVLLVGDHYLKIGEYLAFDLDGNPIVVTEKPATGGYLYATVGTIEDTPVVTIVLSNFSFEYTGAAAIVALQDNMYIMQLEGENTITAHADKNYDALYPDAFVNGAGIGAMGSQLVIVGEGSLTVNAEVGIFGFDSSFAVQNGATVTINAQQDGIEIQNGIFAVADATLTVNAGVDGVDISDGRVVLAAASRVFVTAGDDGFTLSYADFLATNAIVTVVAVDDAVDADGCYIEWENSTFDLTADDHGITVYADSEGEYAFFVTDSILNIEAGDDGIRIYGYPEVFFAGSILNITAEDAGLYFDSTRVMFASQLGMILSLNSTPGTSGKASEVNINAKRNYLCDASVDVYEIKLNVVVTETAFELDYASLYFVDSEISIVSRDTGIYSEYEADVNVYDSTLSIEAARYGINGYLYLDIRGDLIDISVRAFEAIYCEDIYFEE
ncbi:MAG: carbohydrate-binding domain-containing protein, partial [Ruminococcaceae bacterium]|nr:carbohydrate-binding domain-containing protein [Oscillospiraceae bacterium]